MYFGTVWTVWVPKKFVTLFPDIFHVKAKWSIVYEYLKTKIFSRDTNILPQMHWTSNIFGHSAITIGSFWVSLNYPILNFKKTVCPKNVWMWHCRRVSLLLRSSVGEHIKLYLLMYPSCCLGWYVDISPFLPFLMLDFVDGRELFGTS